MRKGVFKPYTKQRVVEILRQYFQLSKEEAEKECERLAACVVRDCLDASKYIYLWETSAIRGGHGIIDELHILYPANQR